jgi:uncharacterized protein Veg
MSRDFLENGMLTGSAHIFSSVTLKLVEVGRKRISNNNLKLRKFYPKETDVRKELRRSIRKLVKYRISEHESIRRI